MSGDTRGYELTTSLSINGTSAELLDDHVVRVEKALVQAIANHGAIRAYYVRADYDAVEIKIGLRFEGMEAKYVEGTANDAISEAIEIASGTSSGEPLAVREESTLVPA